jgi:hypothetical protein
LESAKRLGLRLSLALRLARELMKPWATVA